MINVKKANEMSPDSGAFTVLAGPPGLGKSWVAGSIGEYHNPEEVLLIATLPREVNSYQYQRHNFDTMVIVDDEWDASGGKAGMKATGYKEMIRVLRELRADEKYSAIIIDNGTDMGEFAWHESLQMAGVFDPSELRNAFAPYTSVREKMENLIRNLIYLTGKVEGKCARPKQVIVPWHVQPAKETTDDNQSADQKGKDAEYAGNYLPTIRGGFRRHLLAKVDQFFFLDIVKHREPGVSKSVLKHMVQVVSDNDRHTKYPGYVDASELINGKYVDIHGRDDAWRQIMKVINGGS